MKLPKQLFVYLDDYNGGNPIFAVATKMDEIPEDHDSEQIGIYILNRQSKFTVTRKLS
jgi:hypothetical protein